ncbi:synembryn-A [Colossoma macropomum]|uniref:synembryn-A n=1 Tax=Colossoma macropomum TaxID=42526 RepID=UPI001864F754|nr:synembryn-A [Colossoma macropomum]
MDVERIIECIQQHDHEGLRTQLQQFNKEYAQCFFFDVEEWERRKRQELEEFKKNKVRDYESDSESADEGSGDREIILRQSLASILVRFLQSGPQGRVTRVCLRTLRILSRDQKVLDRLLTDSALITLARLAGFSQAPVPEEDLNDQADPFRDVVKALSDLESNGQEEDEACAENEDESADAKAISTERRRRSSVFRALTRGKRDTRASVVEDEDEEEEERKGADKWEEEQNKEAVKILCNVIYNSAWAQERAAELSLLSGLTEKLAKESQSASPPSGQYYELRLIFLLTALRPELRNQLKQEGGVAVLTAVLEQCVSVQWKDQYEVVLDPAAAPVSMEDSLRSQEALKILFNITYSAHTQEPGEEDAALYRRLAAVLRHCLMVRCEGEEDTDELKGHTVNLLSALPLNCLDVLLCVPLRPDSEQIDGVNMDCVHALLLFLEKRLEMGQKVKERLTPVLNLLTECSRAHRGTRRYLRQQILPPLRDASVRPEQGTTVKSRLVRLMTHLDTELKHCAADLLFVLCKENVGRFVKYTGYGNAAGLLATRGLLGGQRSKGSTSSGTQYSSDSDSDTDEYRQVKGRINPVTGSVEEEQPDPMEGMTEEEKEEEACRLVSLINKLSKDNMIQPMGLDAQGQLTPLTGLRDLSMEEEGSEEEDTDDLENVE